jgi:hypothetical protein
MNFSSRVSLSINEKDVWWYSKLPIFFNCSFTALFFSERGIDVEHERINAHAKLRDYKRHLVRHQSRNKMHVTAQPIKLSNGDGAFLVARLFQRGGELRALAKGIGPFARLDLCERGGDPQAVGFGKPCEGLLLRRQTEARPCLFLRTDPVIGD